MPTTFGVFYNSQKIYSILFEKTFRVVLKMIISLLQTSFKCPAFWVFIFKPKIRHILSLIEHFHTLARDGRVQCSIWCLDANANANS